MNRCLLSGLVWDLPGDSVSIGTADLDGLPAAFFYGAGWFLLVACLSGEVPDNAPRLELRAIDHTDEALPCQP